MTEREFRKLRRSDFLELLIDRMKENELLHEQLETVKGQLTERTLLIENAGSIAEAALQLNGIFQAAEAAAQQYLDNIKRLNKYQDEICQRKLMEAQQAANQIISSAEAHKAKCKKEADEYWANVSQKLDCFWEEHQTLREILQYEKK